MLGSVVTSGAGNSEISPPGLAGTSGSSNVVPDSKPASSASATPITPVVSTPSHQSAASSTHPQTSPATPAQPATPATPSQGGGGATPATPATGATPATPAQPNPTPSPSPIDTPPPVISNIEATSTQTSATITWTTNEAASSDVRYESVPLLSATTTILVTGTSSVTSHAVTLSNLKSSQSYHFIVISTDTAGNTATSSEQSFTTLTPPPPPDYTIPTISDVVVGTLWPKYAIIDWRTDESSTGSVEYGLTTAYGSIVESDRDPGYYHHIALTNLTPERTYHYRVGVVEPSGNRAYSSVYTFTTPADTGSGAIRSGSGVVADSHELTIGTGHISYSQGNATRGYIYPRSGTVPTLSIADVVPLTSNACFLKYGYPSSEGYQGIPDICQFTSAADHSFTNNFDGVQFGDKNSGCYQGIMLFEQDGFYGALEFEDIDSSGALHYNYWYDDAGEADFSSLCGQ